MTHIVNTAGEALTRRQFAAMRPRYAAQDVSKPVTLRKPMSPQQAAVLPMITAKTPFEPGDENGARA